MASCLLISLGIAVQAHAISSTANAEETFGAISAPNLAFTVADFYVFVFEFSGRCVAHGANTDFVGLTLYDIMGTLDMPDTILSGANDTHEQFIAAAVAGGGWVQYEWDEPTQPSFQKVAYIFSLYRDGIEYYGGVREPDCSVLCCLHLLTVVVDWLRRLRCVLTTAVLQVLPIQTFRMMSCRTWQRVEAKADDQSAARRSTERTVAKRIRSAFSARCSRISSWPRVTRTTLL